jgi:hypothetical protein
MPAQICHILFAEEALKQSLGDHSDGILEQHGNVFRFGAQGPDFFYHNQRTRPTGLKYGVSAHREGYGRLVAALVREHLRLASRASEAGTQTDPTTGRFAAAQRRAYILGFVTHAYLDRGTHPFINYFSGWVEPGKPETDRYFRCHVFMERILDVLMLRLRRAEDVRSFSLPENLSSGPSLPYGLLKPLLKALNTAYPRMSYKSRDRQRIENAYQDSLSFYSFTDPSDPQFRPLAVEHDLREGGARRRLALFHPYELAEGVDFLNLRGRSWCHPCREDWVYTHSFPELYEQALEEASDVIARIAEILDGAGNPDSVENLIGNESLGTGLPWKESPPMQFSDPLPLPEILDRLYRDYEPSAATELPY